MDARNTLTLEDMAALMMDIGASYFAMEQWQIHPVKTHQTNLDAHNHNTGAL